MSTPSAKSARRPPKTARRTTEQAVKTAKKPGKGARAAAGKVAKSARSAPRPVVKATKATKASKSAMTARTAKTAAAKISPAPTLAPEFAAAAAMIRTASPPMQPEAVREAPIRAHKYRVGETVYYTSPTFGRAAASGSYTVVRLLPSEGDDYQYRIKSSGEAFERVAKESQLDRA